MKKMVPSLPGIGVGLVTGVSKKVSCVRRPPGEPTTWVCGVLPNLVLISMPPSPNQPSAAGTGRPRRVRDGETSGFDLAVGEW